MRIIQKIEEFAKEKGIPCNEAWKHLTDLNWCSIDCESEDEIK